MRCFQLLNCFGKKITWKEGQTLKWNELAMNPSVDIVIPTFNGKELLAANLPVLLSEVGFTTETAPPDIKVNVIIVDDGSKDGTVAFLTEQFPTVKIIARPKQGGFSLAVNDGMSAGQGEFILCLNNDIEVTKGFLLPLLESFTDPALFAVTARLLISDEKKPDQMINESGHAIFFANCRLKQRRIPSKIIEKITKPIPVSFAPGACVLYRRSILEKLGGFDPVFAPFYWEDVDISYRALKRGYKILYQPASTVYHKHSTTINKHFIKEYVDAIFWRNLLILNWKNLTYKKLWMQHIMSLPVEFLFALIGGRRNFLIGFMSALGKIKLICKSRALEKKEATINDQELLQKFLEWERDLVSKIIL